MHQSPAGPAGPAGAKAASLVPAIRAGSTGQPNLCQHSLDIRPKKRFAACNPSHQAQRVFLSVACPPERSEGPGAIAPQKQKQ